MIDGLLAAVRARSRSRTSASLTTPLGVRAAHGELLRARQQVLLIATLVLASACPLAAASAVPAATKVDVVSTAIPQTQLTALHEIVRGLPSRRIVESKLGQPPPSTAQAPGVWIYYKLRLRRGFDYVRGEWQVDLTSGVLRDISRSHNWPNVLGQTITLILPSGRERHDSDIAIGTAFRGTVASTSDNQLRLIANRSARAAGTKLITVALARVLGRTAVELTVKTDRPREFLRERTTNMWKIMTPITHGAQEPLAEGVFVVVRDRHGAWVTVSGYAVRAAAGGSTTNPRFD
jgi:hypothetical protein